MVEYLCGMWRKPESFRPAAEEAVSFIFSNWVFPQHWKDFRRYARQTVWGCYAQGARNSPDSSPRGTFLPREDWAEQQEERSRRGKRVQLVRGNYVSVFKLARESGIPRQRIYEAIKARKLLATKIGQSLRIERGTADKFIHNAKQKQELVDLRKLLCLKGVSKGTLRKRIYRFKKDGVSERNIIEYVKQTYSRLLPKKSTRRPNSNR